MGMFTDLGMEEVSPLPNINTGTLFDIATGAFEKGSDGNYLLNGGLPPIFGIVGRGGQYKSTIVDTFIAHLKKRYPEIEAWKHDTEQNVFTKKRFDIMAGQEISQDIHLTNSAALPMDQMLEELRKAGEYRLKHKKDLFRKTPFIDVTGKSRYAWIPMLMDIDSFSMLRTVSECMAAYSGKPLEDSSRNMDDMTDGRVKRKLMFDLSRWSFQYGIYFMLPAQISDKANINPYEPIKKQLQFLQNGDHIKGVGNQYAFLTNTLLQNTNPKPLIDSNKGPEYPNGGLGARDINELQSVVLRCKTAPSGTIIPFLVSQNGGILSDLTHYHYLKNSGDFGFIKKGHNRYLTILEDVLLHRNSIISTLETNYEASRAMELMAQFCWMHNNWNTLGSLVDIPATPEVFAEKLKKCSTSMVSDILNSRGYWIFDGQKDERPYMSLYDVFYEISKN